MLNVNAFVLLCIGLAGEVTRRKRIFLSFGLYDDIRTVTMSTEKYGLAVACFQVYCGITKSPNITFRKPTSHINNIYQYFVIGPCLSN